MELISQFERVRDVDLIYDFAKTISGKRVLEIGCGGGERTILFVQAHNTDRIDVTAIDIIDARKSEFANGYNFLIADGRNLPFEGEIFDSIV